MTPTLFADFKYQHGGSRQIRPARWVPIVGLPLLSLVGLVFGLPYEILPFLLLVPVFLFFGSPRVLRLGPRYLVCGRQVIHYANVTALTLDADAGRLELLTLHNQRLVLQRERFPTAARKTPKIAANRAAKFLRVSGKLLEKVRKAAPGARLSGVD